MSVKNQSPKCPCGCGPMVFCISDGEEVQSFVWTEHQAQLFMWLCERLEKLPKGANIGMTEAPQPMDSAQLYEVLVQVGQHPAGQGKSLVSWTKDGEALRLEASGAVWVVPNLPFPGEAR